MYSTLQIQGIKRFACQTRLLQTQNAFKRGAKRVYYKRKTRANAEQNACKRGAKRVYYKRKTRLLAMLNAFAGNVLCETRLD